MLNALCADLELDPGGGYSATAFGNALRKLGLKDATDRRRFIEINAAIQVRGAGPDKRYFILQSG